MITKKITLTVNACLTASELEELGIFPRSINAYSYSFGILYRKGNQRIILQPLEDKKYKVLRMYTVYDFD